MTKLEFLKRVTNDYDYSLLPQDIKSKSYIDIVCKKHGKISVRMDVLLKGGICRKCSDEKRSNKSKILDRFIEKYGTEYDYDISNYKNSCSKIKIVCKKHGEFYTTANNHLNGRICKKCKSENYKISKSEIEKRTLDFISKYIKLYGDIYDYSKVIYERSDKKIIIICKKHGEFLIKASHHMSGKGCKKCTYERSSVLNSHTTEQFINSIKEIHGDFYDYSKVNYINSKTKVDIICPKHGTFKQTPHEHKMGYGCQECNITIGERKISVILQKYNIKYDFQKIFDDCIYVNKLKFDFYLPDYNTCIEFDGVQHFEIVEYFGDEYSYNKRRQRDKVKEEYCDKNNIFLLRIPYFDKNIELSIKGFLFD